MYDIILHLLLYYFIYNKYIIICIMFVENRTSRCLEGMVGPELNCFSECSFWRYDQGLQPKLLMAKHTLR